ncbi:hypothetical protein [Brevibacillus sp. H7]|uniref:hypothetical protein n=1 Tax=Brevibacillus sp. H7 TaxID=3349138 RepID=UPI0038302C04
MENNPRFHLFAFEPDLLREVSRKVEARFKNVEQSLVLSRRAVLLPKLLEKIRGLSFTEIVPFAQSLKKMEVLLLLYDYPFTSETDETRSKINVILTTRYSGTVGQRAWGLFQQDLTDRFLQDLIRDCYYQDRVGFMGIEETFLRLFEPAMEEKQGIVHGLVSSLQKASFSTREVLKKWKVKEESLLEEELIKRLFAASLSDDRIIKKDGVPYIVERLEYLSLQDYKHVLKFYLEAREHLQFHFLIMEQAIRRLLDPRERETEWDFLSERALKQVHRWLIGNELKKFFETDENNERIEYWKRFINYMNHVESLKDPSVVFIYFEGFVVVEFRKIGAAYFYHEAGFQQFIHSKIHLANFKHSKNTAKKESMLKDTNSMRHGIKLFINKLDHRGDWQRKFDIQMRQYLKE